MANGIPSLDIPPIEPLKVDRVLIEQGTRGRNSLKSLFKDVEIGGLKSSKMKRVSINFDKFRLRSEIITDRLDFVGNYKINGQIIIPISGEGRANISMHQASSIHDLKGEYITNPEDGQIYLNITDYKIKFKPKSVSFYFGNLFNGDKLLGDTTNDFLNQNWKAVFAGLIPEYEKFFGEKFKEVAKSFFEKIPMNKIFLE